MNFHDVNLPKYIEIFAMGSSGFSTSCAVSKSGREVRSSDSLLDRRRYILRDCNLSQAQFDSFNSFFKARGGRRFSFRLRDYADYIVEKQVIAIGDGLTKEYRLQKIYPDKVSPYIRNITKPVLENIIIYLGEQEVIPDEINLETGVILFTEPVKKGSEIVASFEFDVPVRFVSDSFQYSFNQDATISLEDVELIEVFE